MGSLDRKKERRRLLTIAGKNGVVSPEIRLTDWNRLNLRRHGINDASGHGVHETGGRRIRCNIGDANKARSRRIRNRSMAPHSSHHNNKDQVHNSQARKTPELEPVAQRQSEHQRARSAQVETPFPQ